MKIDDGELMRIRLHEVTLAEKRAAADREALEMQSYLDAIWNKYGLRKGVDAVMPDGQIVRGE